MRARAASHSLANAQGSRSHQCPDAVSQNQRAQSSEPCRVSPPGGCCGARCSRTTSLQAASAKSRPAQTSAERTSVTSTLRTEASLPSLPRHRFLPDVTAQVRQRRRATASAASHTRWFYASLNETAVRNPLTSWMEKDSPAFLGPRRAVQRLCLLPAPNRQRTGPRLAPDRPRHHRTTPVIKLWSPCQGFAGCCVPWWPPFQRWQQRS